VPVPITMRDTVRPVPTNLVNSIVAPYQAARYRSLKNIAIAILFIE
jgi:hypothetical protein